jgi:hypothetical protein
MYELLTYIQKERDYYKNYAKEVSRESTIQKDLRKNFAKEASRELASPNARISSSTSRLRETNRVFISTITIGSGFPSRAK